MAQVFTPIADFASQDTLRPPAGAPDAYSSKTRIEVFSDDILVAMRGGDEAAILAACQRGVAPAPAPLRATLAEPDTRGDRLVRSGMIVTTVAALAAACLALLATVQ